MVIEGGLYSESCLLSSTSVTESTYTTSTIVKCLRSLSQDIYLDGYETLTISKICEGLVFMCTWNAFLSIKGSTPPRILSYNCLINRDKTIFSLLSELVQAENVKFVTAYLQGRTS